MIHKYMHTLSNLIIIKGHPFMTSTRRGGGWVRLRWTHVEGEGLSSLWTHRKNVWSSFHAQKLALFYEKLLRTE